MSELRGATIGLLHPGAMGASVGAAATRHVARVVWASQGRSTETHERARRAKLEELPDLAALVATSRLIISVCPPDAARDVAEQVARVGFEGVYVDANAVSPATARAIADVFTASRTDFVDGGIIGPPAVRPGTTRLHLSGPRAGDVAACFAGTPLEARVVDGPIGAASALKMSFAAYTKGTSALLAAIYTLASSENVTRELLAEWDQLLPDLRPRLTQGVPAAATKAWRFKGEMQEIAATFQQAGLPPGFHEAAAEIYERLTPFKDARTPPTPDQIATKLRPRS